MSPAPIPPPTAEATELATLKRKVAILEAEHELSKGQDTRRYVHAILRLIKAAVITSCSASVNQIHAGRSLRRIVNLFVAPWELVQEADNRIDRLAADEDTEFSAE